MKLNLEQIKTITQGAVRISEDSEGIHFYRFTKEQEELYREADAGHYLRTFATAGIKFVFKTDSKKLFLSSLVKTINTRNFFSFDVLVNDVYVGSLDNYSDVELPENYTEEKFPYGDFEKEFDLGEGVKVVKVHLPYSAIAIMKEVSLDDGAVVEPIEMKKKVLVFGDSITQGYDALHTYKRYAARIAESMEAEEMNKAISGEFFFPPLAETDDDFEPDYVTVAYGTNDWSKTKREDFQRKSKAFYTSLSKKYPRAKIFGITPLWRKDYQEYREFGLFEDMINDTVKAVEGLENVILLHGFDMVPKEPKYFGDLRLHPRDEGFDHYFENLNKEIQKYI
jgi:lysophospholipase L1-like esterase